MLCMAGPFCQDTALLLGLLLFGTNPEAPSLSLRWALTADIVVASESRHSEPHAAIRAFLESVTSSHSLPSDRPAPSLVQALADTYKRVVGLLPRLRKAVAELDLRGDSASTLQLRTAMSGEEGGSGGGGGFGAGGAGSRPGSAPLLLTSPSPPPHMFRGAGSGAAHVSGPSPVGIFRGNAASKGRAGSGHAAAGSPPGARDNRDGVLFMHVASAVRLARALQPMLLSVNGVAGSFAASDGRGGSADSGPTTLVSSGHGGVGHDATTDAVVTWAVAVAGALVPITAEFRALPLWSAAAYNAHSSASQGGKAFALRHVKALLIAMGTAVSLAGRSLPPSAPVTALAEAALWRQLAAMSAMPAGVDVAWTKLATRLGIAPPTVGTSPLKALFTELTR